MAGSARILARSACGDAIGGGADAPAEDLEEICDNCERPMVVKRGRFGSFLAAGDVLGDGAAEIVVGTTKFSSKMESVYVFQGVSASRSPRAALPSSTTAQCRAGAVRSTWMTRERPRRAPY